MALHTNLHHAFSNNLVLTSLLSTINQPEKISILTVAHYIYTPCKKQSLYTMQILDLLLMEMAIVLWLSHQTAPLKMVMIFLHCYSLILFTKMSKALLELL